MPWHNTPEKIFSAVRGCPRSCARTNPWFRGQILRGKCAQEPPPGSALKHCWFLGTGGGGTAHTAGLAVECRFACVEESSYNIMRTLLLGGMKRMDNEI